MKKLKLQPYVELFWWVLNLNAIPSNEFLMNRRLLDFKGYPRGCNAIENSEHIAVNCTAFHLKISAHKNMLPSLPTSASLEESFRELAASSKSNPFLGNLYCSAKSRNKLKHGGIEDCIIVLAANSVSFATASFWFNLFCVTGIPTDYHSCLLLLGILLPPNGLSSILMHRCRAHIKQE
ncbi:hypothetical protein M5K25_013723 [Dendrobium thyrsiflorum]|uniref:Uncharacterized protein n=1 Tax=Dendrobium thyrsiflorum TaxID=117978 RepID=A0ABD0UUD2_DENTH